MVEPSVRGLDTALPFKLIELLIVCVFPPSNFTEVAAAILELSTLNEANVLSSFISALPVRCKTKLLSKPLLNLAVPVPDVLISSLFGAPITFLAKVIFPLPVSITVSEVSVTELFGKSIALLAVVILPEIFVAPEPLLLMPPLKLQSPFNVSALLVLNSV